MAINAVCPECRAAYQLSEQQEGKKVRCKHCDAVFVVVAQAPRKTAVRAVPAPSQERAARPTSMAPRRAPARTAREDEDDARSEGRRKPAKSPMPWILGGCMALLGLLLIGGGGGTVVWLLVRDNKPVEVANNTSNNPPAKTDPQPVPQPLANPPANPANPNQPIQGQPIADPPAEKEIKPPADPPQERETRGPAAEDAPRRAAPASDGPLRGEALRHVKRATVYIEVTMADGSRASGSGFFGCKEARNLILTNAHVVGMLSPDSERPRAIDVFINSGQSDEKKTTARVLGVDRFSDLAVLDIGPPPAWVPEPLEVKSADGLEELVKLYVAGFPLGKSLGKEITIRDTTVSSLRKKNGRLDRIQVNGGMDPGNSGGPVVDGSGAVVGVSVAGIPGRQINFAIPGDRVHVVLNGRISGLAIHQPYYGDSNKVVAPYVVEMIDPRNRIKEVGVEIWIGDKGANRPATQKPPPPRPGDSGRTYFRLTYHSPEGKGDILLPELPPGKIYWHQPKWVDSVGQAHWASGNPVRLPMQPVYRKPANLVLRMPQGAKRQLDLNIETSFKVSSDEDSDNARIRTLLSFEETVFSSGANGSQLKLRYRVPPRRDLIVSGKAPEPSPLLAEIKSYLPRVITTLQVDRFGNITRQVVDNRPLLPLLRAKPDLVSDMKDFHEIVQQSLESLAVSLPPNGQVNPLESWKAQRHLPIDTPGKFESGQLDVTFTYAGVRKRDGRDEAVINMEGMARGSSKSVGGKANGVILVDLATGQTLLATATVVMQLEARVRVPGEGVRNLRLIATMQSKMQRKL
jgi:predicted Zn finger-like uncharacterized protein